MAEVGERDGCDEEALWTALATLADALPLLGKENAHA
jgi:hypothetical protein